MLTGLALAALVLTAGLAPRFGRPGAVALAAVSVLWFLVNKPVEGDTLVYVTHDHGLTSADLGGVAGLLLALWVWFRPRR
ncbi:MAG: hypothetical protein JWO76_1543 [Nocardioides sp.]|nr:hypothetical protein [Nocardioides sp.]